MPLHRVTGQVALLGLGVMPGLGSAAGRFAVLGLVALPARWV